MSFTATKINLTDDAVIRSALMERLNALHSKDKRLRIVEELGVMHGAARVDVAVVNGVLHGYEIKSDKDTLFRLEEQIDAYNAVFDEITIVVGKSHLYEAINMVPDWWGVMIAKIVENDLVMFNTIRVASDNPEKNGVAIASLLWRDEALELLEKAGEAKGLRSKSRNMIYSKLSSALELEVLCEEVRRTICFRKDWRSDSQLVLNGG